MNEKAFSFFEQWIISSCWLQEAQTCLITESSLEFAEFSKFAETGTSADLQHSMTGWNKRFYLTAMSVFEFIKTRSEDQLFKIYEEAIQSVDKIEWKILMKDEFDFLIKNHIWILMSEKELFSD